VKDSDVSSDSGFAYKIVVGRSEWQQPPGRRGLTWESHIQADRNRVHLSQGMHR